jgi:hypothetical protein
MTAHTSGQQTNETWLSGAHNLDENMALRMRNKYDLEATHGVVSEPGVFVPPERRWTGVARLAVTLTAANTRQVSTNSQVPVRMTAQLDSLRRESIKYPKLRPCCIGSRIIGLVVEYTPATGETRVRFPDDAMCHTKFFNFGTTTNN